MVWTQVGNIKGPSGASPMQRVLVSTGSEARPNTDFVIWVGGDTQPENMIGGDIWFTAAPVGSAVAPTINTATLAQMTVSVSYNQTLAATGSTPITWAVSVGILPDGLGLGSTTGTLSGTPTTAGAYDFTVSATNAGGTDTQQFTGTVAAAPSGATTHSIFGASAPTATYSDNNDANSGDWTAAQFYITGSPARSWFVQGARYYVPVGSSLIGKTAKAALMRRASTDGGVYAPGSVPQDFASNGTSTNFPSVLAAGWNEVNFVAPLIHFDSGDGIVIAVSVGDGSFYLASSDLTESAIQASDGANMYLSEVGGTTATRSWYATGSGMTSQLNRHYGMDIIVSES